MLVRENRNSRGAQMASTTPSDLRGMVGSANTLLTSVLCAAFLSVQSPLSSHALTALSDADGLSPPIAGSLGMSSMGSSTPYFSSASAARLLVDPTPTTRASPEARRQFAKQKALQDLRLEQCRDTGFDWEQCFYYGTGGQGSSAASLTLPNMQTPPHSSNGHQVGTSAGMRNKPPPTKTKVPTW